MRPVDTRTSRVAVETRDALERWVDAHLSTVHAMALTILEDKVLAERATLAAFRQAAATASDALPPLRDLALGVAAQCRVLWPQQCPTCDVSDQRVRCPEARIALVVIAFARAGGPAGRGLDRRGLGPASA